MVGAAGRGDTYGPIYQELERQMHGLVRLAVSGTCRSAIDEQSRARLNKFYLNIRRRISDLDIDIDAVMATWPPRILGSVAQRWKPDNKPVFRPFALEVFRAGHHRNKRRQRSRGLIH